jgi:peptidoglycan/xylan/chitin deacetylase (PgdA/CDA1 family)
MWILAIVGVGVVALAHLAPTRFILDAMAGDRAAWHMPRDSPPTVYLTFDDGPNPTTTPDLLDVLARERARATFFLIDEHVTEETAPIVQRMFADDHAVALHSATKTYMLLSPSALARRLTTAADRIYSLTGQRPCRAFRPRGGWRSGSMYLAMRQLDYRLIGWGWMLWDVNPLGARTAENIFERLVSRVRPGDIMVMHDGDDAAPRRDQRQTVDATARLIPALRDRGFVFGTVCQNERPSA